jgi:hypothetical protein
MVHIVCCVLHAECSLQLCIARGQPESGIPTAGFGSMMSDRPVGVRNRQFMHTPVIWVVFVWLSWWMSVVDD